MPRPRKRTPKKPLRGHSDHPPPAGKAGNARRKSSLPQPKGRKLRIIGGKFGGRQLLYSGDPRTRPMKDNIREAVFNLIGGWIPGKHVFDLFAGSGAIGLEALSRGAKHVTMIERHFPTAKLIRQNIATLGADSESTVITSDTFFWVRQFLAESRHRPKIPWVFFCSPPYDFYVDLKTKTQLLESIQSLLEARPPGSVFVVECDGRFDPADLPMADQWRVRDYAVATVCVFREAAQPIANSV